jgi:hypothetical protein
LRKGVLYDAIPIGVKRLCIQMGMCINQSVLF